MSWTVLPQNKLKVADNGPDPSQDFDFCVTFSPFTGLGRPEQLLLCKEAQGMQGVKTLNYNFPKLDHSKPKSVDSHI